MVIGSGQNDMQVAFERVRFWKFEVMFGDKTVSQRISTLLEQKLNVGKDYHHDSSQ